MRALSPCYRGLLQFSAHRREMCFLTQCSCFSSFFGTEEHFFRSVPSPWQSGDFNSQIANCKLGGGKKKKEMPKSGPEKRVWQLKIEVGGSP